ncbi:MAG: choice-of-anchor tandem repeat GloVer-containing protein [Rhizomicrobium sp.]|jgi:uncharacterized repeat protein (TIGR03803 family)
MKTVSGAIVAGAIACAILQPVSAGERTTVTEKVIYSFCSQANCADGVRSYAGLLAVNGMLYGTTFDGGTRCANGGCGTVFSINPETGAETVLYTFAGGTDGAQPHASLIYVNGTLYGTTVLGGMTNATCNSGGCGTVFAFDLKTGKEKVLYAFCSQQNCADGQTPMGGVTDVKGKLYGTTQFGGASGMTKHGGDVGCTGSDCGTVFSVDPKTGAEKVLHTFAGGSDGAWPDAGLIDVRGTLFGTTSGDDVTSAGTVFSLNPKTGKEKTLYNFCSLQGCADGDYPLAGLIDVNGVLYGTTAYGGTGSCDGDGCGTVFSVTTSGVEKAVYSFQGGDDGWSPQAGLVNVKGTLYGTTYEGGEPGNSTLGTVFAVDPKTGDESVVYRFQGVPDGGLPTSNLIDAKGTLYGTTILGGTGSGCGTGNDGCGTVFALTPN